MEPINRRRLTRELYADPDVNDIADANRILDNIKPSTDGHDDTNLIVAWVEFDPNSDDCEERASIIERSINRPVALDDPDGHLRRELCHRIRRTAFDPDREIRELHLTDYDTDRETSGPRPTDHDTADTRSRNNADAARKAAHTRKTNRERAYGAQADSYNRLLDSDPDYWNMLGQGAGLTGDAPWASRYAMADIAARMRDNGYDPRTGDEYRKTPGFRRLEKNLLGGRRTTRMYKRLRTLADNEAGYRHLMTLIDHDPRVWDDDMKRARPIYGFGAQGQTLVLHAIYDRDGLDAVMSVVRGDGAETPSRYGLWRVETLSL